MAKMRASQYRGPQARKSNKAKAIEKAKRKQTRQDNALKRKALRNDMKKFNKEWKLRNKKLNIEKLKVNKVADNIRATGAAVAENLIPSVTAATTANTINNANDNNIKRQQIDQLINSGVQKADTANEEELGGYDFQWR